MVNSEKNGALIQGEWYWVRRKESDWFTAKRDKESSGGWTNEDCWEDFRYEVIEWIHIDKPAKPEGVEA